MAPSSLGQLERNKTIRKKGEGGGGQDAMQKTQAPFFEKLKYINILFSDICPTEMQDMERE